MNVANAAVAKTVMNSSRKPVLVRLTDEMRAGVEAHQMQISIDMGGAPVAFSSALLHLVQLSLNAAATQALAS